MAKNKVIFNGQTIIDLSTDTVSSAADIVAGKTAHLRDGNVVTGTLSFSTIYTGSTTPAASLGTNGDIYLQV